MLVEIAATFDSWEEPPAYKLGTSVETNVEAALRDFFDQADHRERPATAVFFAANLFSDITLVIRPRVAVSSYPNPCRDDSGNSRHRDAVLGG